jgi:superfamily II DNA or RNA helicase
MNPELKDQKKPDEEPRAKKLSRHRKPEGMTTEQWQVELRRQFGRQQKFRLKNLGGHSVFSEFAVTNPQTKQTYRVAIRGEALGVNFCSCPDYAVNTLGTCKHIEFTLARLGRTAKARALLAAGYVPPFSEVYLRYGAQRRVVFAAGTDAPEALNDIAARYFGEQGVLRDDAFGRFEEFLGDVRPLGHELRCYDDALDFIAEVRDADRRRTLIGERYGNGRGAKELARLVKVPLYPYQAEGALFAARAGRSLIADDMGLGKTVEAIAAAEILAKELGVQSALIVCPTSLKYQWKSEIEKFCGRPAVVIEGLSHMRRELYAAPAFFKIVNYDVVHRDLDAIAAMAPELVILDEAQRIKNWQTRRAQSVKRIASPYAIVLTGTPLENRLEELYSIVEFVDRYRLGPLFRFLEEHQVTEEGTTRVVGYRNLSAIGTTLAPILLRRTKKEVLQQLPERMDKCFFVPMTEQQWEIHEENREIVARIVAKWRRYGFLTDADQRCLTIALQRMRMACDNTYLVDHKTFFGPKLDELSTLLGEIFERPENKVVVFSQWTRMNDLVAERLESRSIGFEYLHGGVPARKRRDLLAAFREDPRKRAFLSTDAGGVGLNLQTASTVINLDLPWNPAVLEQRIGRVHRIGQHRPVQVVNFVSQGTIEHGMLSVLAFKSSLFAGVLDGGEDSVFLGETRLKRFMKQVEAITQAVPPTPHEPPPEPRDEEDEEAGEDERGVPVAEEKAAATGAASPLQPLVEAGVAFLRELGSALAASRQTGRSPLAGLMERDEATGRSYLRIPVPNPKVIETAVAAIGPLLEAFGALGGPKRD